MSNITADVQVCFRCGQKGHWARDCKHELSAQAAVDLSWCVNDISLLSSSAAALPSVLRPDIASICVSRSTAAFSIDCTNPMIQEASGLASVIEQPPIEREASGSEHQDQPLPEKMAPTGHTEPIFSAYAMLRQLVQDSFGYADFKSFQFPVIQQLLAVCSAVMACSG